MDEATYTVSFEHTGLDPVSAQCKSREEAERLMRCVREQIESGKYFLFFENDYTSSWFIIPLDPIPVVRMYEDAR